VVPLHGVSLNCYDPLSAGVLWCAALPPLRGRLSDHCAPRAEVAGAMLELRLQRGTSPNLMVCNPGWGDMLPMLILFMLLQR